MTSNNVVMFPKPYKGPVDTSMSMEIITKNTDMMKQFHIQETLTNVIPMIFNQLDISGFSFDDIDKTEDNSIKDGALIVEAIRSFMCKYYEISHPFQTLAQNIFVSDSEDPETLNIVDNLNIKLKEEILSL